MRLTPLALTLLLVAPPVMAAEEQVVATVNGEAITLVQMQAMADTLGEQAANMPAPALWDLLLDQLIRQAALAQAGDAVRNPRDDAGLEVARRAYLAALALEKVAAPDPTEAELKAVYETAYGTAEPKTEYDASHILVDTAEAAAAVEAELAAGKDFGAVAEERSTGPSGPNRGDLGWFTLDMMVPPFAEAVAKLKKGEVSAPVQTDFGWHVIRLNDTRTLEVPEFDDVREQLAVQVRRDRVEAEVKRVSGAAKVEKTEGIDPAMLRKKD